MTGDWLVRLTNGKIQGPITSDALKSMLDHGQIPADAEICKTNSYWFGFRDIDELKKHFTNEEISKLFRFGRDSDGTNADKTRADIERSVKENKKQPLRTASGPLPASHHPQQSQAKITVEHSQYLGLLFFVGIVAAILAATWLLHKFSS